ncbi:MAG TPA: DUF2279 domain-containing protein [Usitatibacter sp.]|nr:DUF2279 domain-containing protein [Usitatibacter sp.]
MDLPSYDQLLAQAHGLAVAEVHATAAAQPMPKPPNLRLRNATLIAGGAAVVAAYGYHAWWKDGFTRDFRRRSEGGFGANTEFSGIDKMGHLYSAYVGVRAMSPLFEFVGNSPGDARRLAAWSTWGAMTAVEVLDGFSREYRFSHEDFIANTVGVLFGYALASHPEWDDLLDFRLFYRQTPLSNWDPIGDYPGQRYYLVAKADGVKALRDVPVLRYLEFGVGYGAPGIDTPDEWNLHDFAQRRREIFISVGVNLSRVIADVFYGGRRSTTRTQRGLDLAFEIVQHPAHAYRGWNVDSYSAPPPYTGPGGPGAR